MALWLSLIKHVLVTQFYKKKIVYYFWKKNSRKASYTYLGETELIFTEIHPDRTEV